MCTCNCEYSTCIYAACKHYINAFTPSFNSLLYVQNNIIDIYRSFSLINIYNHSINNNQVFYIINN